MKTFAIWLFQLFMGATAIYGQSIQAVVSSDSLSTGDVFHLSITAQYNPDVYEVIFPDSSQFDSDIEYLSSRKFRGISSRDSLVYTLQFFALQDTVLTGKTVTFSSDERILQVSTPEIPLYFKSLVNPMEQNLRPLKPLFEFARSWWLLLLLLIASVLLAIAAYRYRDKLRRNRTKKILPTPTIPDPFHDPIQHLYNQIVHLQVELSSPQGDYTIFYTELSEAFRQYFESVHEIPALESTTREVIRDLKRRGVDDQITGSTQQLLRDSDLVKFAKFKPDPEFAQKSYVLAESLVKSIKKKDAERVVAMRYRYEQNLGLNATTANVTAEIPEESNK